MQPSKNSTDFLRQMLLDDKNGTFTGYRENISTIILALDILEDINLSTNNKELVQVIRRSFAGLLESLIDRKNTGDRKPP